MSPLDMIIALKWEIMEIYQTEHPHLWLGWYGDELMVHYDLFGRSDDEQVFYEVGEG